MCNSCISVVSNTCAWEQPGQKKNKKKQEKVKQKRVNIEWSAEARDGVQTNGPVQVVAQISWSLYIFILTAVYASLLVMMYIIMSVYTSPAVMMYIIMAVYTSPAVKTAVWFIRRRRLQRFLHISSGNLKIEWWRSLPDS